MSVTFSSSLKAEGVRTRGNLDFITGLVVYDQIAFEKVTKSVIGLTLTGLSPETLGNAEILV